VAETPIGSGIKRGKKHVYVWDTCPQCRQGRWVRNYRMGTICRGCYLDLLRSRIGLNWKGGETQSDGYIMIYMPDHPYAHKSGYIKRSHLLMEKVLGRYILRHEIVHHKNEIRDDDSPENLEVKSPDGHTSEHNRKLNKAQNMMKYRWG